MSRPKLPASDNYVTLTFAEDGAVTRTVTGDIPRELSDRQLYSLVELLAADILAEYDGTPVQVAVPAGGSVQSPSLMTAA